VVVCGDVGWSATATGTGDAERGVTARGSGVCDFSFFALFILAFFLHFMVFFSTTGAGGASASSECATESRLALRFSAFLCRCGVGTCIVIVVSCSLVCDECGLDVLRSQW
jgi:hypothetical protein